jgi:hypothetical protein
VNGDIVQTLNRTQVEGALHEARAHLRRRQASLAPSRPPVVAIKRRRLFSVP